jgi:hypothetical protein
MLFIILKIILDLFLALIALLTTLLIVPFTYRGEAAVMDGVSYSYRIGWFWNLFNVRGSSDGDMQKTEVYLGSRKLFTVDTKKKDTEKEKPKDEKEADEEDEKDREKAKRENNLKSMFEVKFIKEAFEFLKKILRQLKPKHLQLKGVYGFEDPSLTGMTAGFIYTLQAIVPQSRIELRPCFTDAVLELEAEANGKIRVGKLAYDTARFLLKPDIRKKIFKKSKKVKQKRKH